jgi:hypothetical protein
MNVCKEGNLLRCHLSLRYRVTSNVILVRASQEASFQLFDTSAALHQLKGQNEDEAKKKKTNKHSPNFCFSIFYGVVPWHIQRVPNIKENKKTNECL